MVLPLGSFLLLVVGVPTTLASPNSNHADAFAEEDVCVGTQCALNQLQAAGAPSKKKISTDTFTDSTTTERKEDGQCSILAGRKTEFPPKLIPGNYDTNMENCKLPDLDLSGVWWIWWTDRQSGDTWKTPFIYFLDHVYNFVRFEILLTFSGCSLNGPADFHTISNMQIGMAQQWSYGSFPSGRIFMWSVYMLEALGLAPTYIPWAFENSTYATCESQGYEFIYLNENQWLRPTHLYVGPLYMGTYTYTMTRVVDGSGQQTKYWDTFTRKGDNYRTWGVERKHFCKRAINGFTQMFFFPLSWGCWWSNLLCKPFS